MKFIFKLITLTFLTLLVISCDPAQEINFINKTDSNVKVKINISPNNTSERLNEMSKGDTIVYELKPNDTANIHFGMGTWEENEVEEKAKCFESIEIETQDIKTVYKSLGSITAILKDNRKGLWWKSNIEIEIE